MSFKQWKRSAKEKALSPEEQQQNIDDVRKLIGPIADKLPVLCSDASIARYLRARNWNTKKASKMLKETLKWRLQYKPEKIQWEDIAHEAETGKIFRASYRDKLGRPVLVMRPGFQNTNLISGQIKYLVYCMENAIMNLTQNQEQMVWLVDFQGWAMASVSVKVTRETAHILQDHYPERLGLGILYNPPKIFESFWTMVKPFLEPKTYNKVKFVYSDDLKSQQIMQEVFDMDKLDVAFGGRNRAGFDYQTYAQQMKEDDVKRSNVLNSSSMVPYYSSSVLSESHESVSPDADLDSNASDEVELSSGDEATPSTVVSIDDKTRELSVDHKDMAVTGATQINHCNKQDSVDRT